MLKSDARIVLNLRGFKPRGPGETTVNCPVPSIHASLAFNHTAKKDMPTHQLYSVTDWRRVVGNLGEPVMDDWADDAKYAPNDDEQDAIFDIINRPRYDQYDVNELSGPVISMAAIQGPTP
jgi:hypothetical protein